MGRWIRRAGHGITAVAVQASLDDECPVCDHPFGHLMHACIGSVGTMAPRPMLVPEAVVA
jgi:hypothetical protein